MGQEIMDNFALNVRARTKESFAHAISLALAATPSGRISHWCEHPEFGLVLFWHADENDTFRDKKIIPFPHELSGEALISFTWDWLQKSDRKRFKLKGMDSYYSGDGDCEPAWRVYTEEWVDVGGDHRACAAILPVWAWLGK